MLQKGHAPQSGISLLVTLAIATIGLSLCAEAFSAGRMPIGGASTVTYDALGRTTTQRFIGHELPPLPRPVGPSQLTDPDVDLTANAVNIDQKDPNGAPGSTTNRVVFSTTGVDADEDGYIDPTYPDDPNFEANYNLWIMRSDGAEQVQLTDLPGDEVEPCYDPGARLIAFAYVDPATGNSEIYTVEVRNPGIMSCLTDQQPGLKRHPTWSPDGTYVAYQCDLTGNGDWAIFTLPATGAGNQVQLTQPAAEIATDPAWVPTGNRLSPSGQAIAYTATVGTASVVRWIDVHTGEGGDLTDGSGLDMQPAWSRDGAYLAFASDRLTEGDLTRDFNIWRIATPTPTQEPPDPTLVSNWDAANTADDLNPTFSMPLESQPLRIYYESYRADATNTARDIWVTRFADTTNPVLTDLPSTHDAAGNHKRVFGAGDDVIIRVPVYDADSGVARVMAQIKDPDMKVYAQGRSSQWDSSTFPGTQYLEWDCQPIGQIELFDDGDPENGDATAGDGIFSGVYTIPNSLVSDMILDIIARDNSGNEQNYDSVYGFTSEAFSPAGNVLLVNDYCEGQHFIFEQGYNNDFNAMWHTESWFTQNPSDCEAVGNEDVDTIRSYAQVWGADEPYRIWRVICRGPIPLSVYQYYLPTVEYQLDPNIAISEPGDATATVAQRVANRAIIWASPHTGNQWVADGSIIDAGTQADLALFLDRGGRLMITGSDIGWALTLNGTTTNNFYSQYLRASFISHTISGQYVDYYTGYGPYPQQNTNFGVSNFEMTGSGSDPVAFDPWVGQNSPLAHYGGMASPSAVIADDMPTSLDTPDPGGTVTHNDAHSYSYRPDVIQAVGGATVLYSYGNGGTAAVRYEDTNTTARCIYLAFGLESVHRQYSTSGGNHCMNKRSHLVHNALCWMRTGAFQGRVLAAEGGGPIHDEGDPLSNPIVLLWKGDHTPGDSADTPEYAVRCQDDGSYMISGVAPGFYSMEARRGPDYLTDHYDGWVTHGGWDPFVVDFALTKTRPGVIAGVVTSEATGAPLALVNIKVYAVPEEEEEGEEGEEEQEAGAQQTMGEEPDWDTLELVGTAVTAVDGAYKVENLPVGDYYVVADGSPINYGDAWAQASVATGDTTTVNFQLPAADGTLVARVQNIAGDPVGNALIEVLMGSVTVASGVTGENGEAEVSVQPGQYQVRAQAAGYATSGQQNVTIESSERTDPPVLFTLSAEPEGAITGKIVAGSSNAPVGGVVVHVLSNNVDVATPVVTTATLVDPGSGGATYNFTFPLVPTGTVTVRPEPVGFTSTPAEQTVTVVSGETTENVNFILTSLHTFPAGLQLISTPYDYSSNDPATLLGIPAADLLMATWQGSTQQYRQYPQAPADRFRLGTGYWMRLPSAVDITLQGTSSVDPAGIPVQPGWNLLGNPFPVTIDFFTTRVRDNNTGSTMTMQQALAAGTVEGGMYAYALGGYQNTSVFLPWVGTWLKANEAFTLEISGAQGTLTSLADAKPAVLTPEGGWLVNLEASVAGLCDSACHFGMAPTATDGHDVGLDCAKPPVPDFATYIYTSLGNSGTGYAVDVRGSGEAVAQWPLQVRTNAVGADVSLRWPDLTSMPADARPYLVDKVTGKSIYMRTTGSYQFRAGAEPRQFTIVVRSGDAGALTVAGVTAQQVGGDRAQISYTLGTDAAVDVEILNIAGRSVRALCSGAVQGQGVQTVSWDGRNAAGARVPAGRYIVRVTARADDGQQTTGIAALGLRR